jgi:hypothetical protein
VKHLPIVIILAVAAGCRTHTNVASPQDTPYVLVFELDRSVATAGEVIGVKFSFENRGIKTVQIPAFDQLSLGWHTSTAESVTFTSHCDGLRYTKVAPGQKVVGRSEFKVPDLEGEIEVSTHEFPSSQAKLRVILPNKSLEPTPTAVTPPAGAGDRAGRERGSP